jgi:hypothetical protein
MFGEYLLKIKMQLYVKCVCAVKESMQNNWMVELSKYYITIKHFWKSWIMFTMGGQEESKNKLTTGTFDSKTTAEKVDEEWIGGNGEHETKMFFLLTLTVKPFFSTKLFN